MGTRLAHFKYRIASLIFFARIGWELSKMEKTKNTTKKCAECRIDLTLFIGQHIVAKNGKQKTVCGLCASKLEIDGWRVIADAK